MYYIATTKSLVFQRFDARLFNFFDQYASM